MGREACLAVGRFLVAHTRCRTVVDPFCGMGSMLAAANELGLAAVGVERSAKRAARARTLAFAGGAEPTPPGSGAGRRPP